jgi:alpha-L-rhamnosidase
MRLCFARFAVLMLMGVVTGFKVETACGAPAGSPLKVGQLRCEYLENPLGIGETAPRLSWLLIDPARNAGQSAYQIQVASTEKLLTAGTADLWDTEQVKSPETIQIEYAGKPLVSRETCYWRVRSWDRTGQPSAWSEPAHWEMGLLDAKDWDAKWIRGKAAVDSNNTLTIISATYQAQDGSISKDVTDLLRGMVHNNVLETSVTNENLGGDPAYNKVKQLHLRYSLGTATTDEVLNEKAPLNIPTRPLSYLRRSFQVNSPVARARLYVTAEGLYSVDINGQHVGDHVLAPDWTDYHKRIRYQVYDVTADIKTGSNAIGAMTANGWYAGHIGNGGYKYWGQASSLMAQLEISHEDGTVDKIATDDQWKAHASPILDTDFMMGEDYDARLELPNWSAGGLVEDRGWVPVELTDAPDVALNAQVSPPVRELMTLKPKAIFEPVRSHYVFDLGQNMVGVARIKVTGARGSKVTIRFAEMLNNDKSIYTTNYRGAPSIDTYTFKGGGTETWQPRFTFHGFRYVQLTGLTARPSLDAVTGVVIGTDDPQTGQFTCSDPRINQLQSNIQWGQRGNYLSVPTDCPQRDERLGWMGDAQVFIGTAIYNADIAAFFTKWLVDVDDAQTSDGQFTNVSPDNGAGSGSPGWGDAGVICPWTVYRTYGDKRELKRHLPQMMRWVDWMKDHSTDLIRDHDRGSDFGDWLSIGADTPKELMGTAYFAYSTHLVALSAKALGDEENATKYETLFNQIKAAFDAKYLNSDGRLFGDTQTCYAMALAFDLLPDQAARTAAGARLAEKVRQKSDHLSTGFLGVSYLLPALSNQGQVNTAYSLLFQDTFPSWLFSVSHGATTIWERWDGWTPDKGFQDPGMNSFNHYSLGSCGQWLYEQVAGIAQTPDGDSFQKLVIRPRIAGPLTHAAAHYDSIRGRISTDWKLQGGRLTFAVTIPPNVSATVYLPTAAAAGVTESGKPAADSAGIKVLEAEPNTAVFEVQSGSYTFNAAELKAN